MMDAVYPSSASALARGRRLRRADPRQRHRTTPVTFAEIKEVDEENEEARLEVHLGGGACGEVEGRVGETRRRRPDVLEERLGRQFAEFRRRRARTDVLRERDPDSPPPAPAPASAPAPALAHGTPGRAGSEPAVFRGHSADT